MASLQRLHRLARLSLALAALWGLSACGSLGRVLIYQTFRADFAPCPDAEAAGGRVVKDGALRYIEASAGHPRALVLYFHGVGKGACDRANLIKPLVGMGCSLALCEYPGFAEPGEAHEGAMLENALALYDRITAAHPNLPVVLYGESLGTGVATYLAHKRGAAALILQSPYTSALEVGEDSYKMLPVHLFMQDPFDAQDWAKDVKAPVLAMVGSRDWVIPPKFSRRQMKNFAGPTRLEVFEGAGHQTMVEREETRYFALIQAQLDTVAPSR